MRAEKTPEQVAADKVLEDAMQQVARAYAPDWRPPSVITSVVAVWAESWFDDDGHQWSAVGRAIPKDTDAPEHVILGLLEHALITTRAEVLQDEDD